MSLTTDSPELGGVPAPPEHDLFIIHAKADRVWVEGYLYCARALVTHL